MYPLPQKPSTTTEQIELPQTDIEPQPKSVAATELLDSLKK